MLAVVLCSIGFRNDRFANGLFIQDLLLQSIRVFRIPPLLSQQSDSFFSGADPFTRNKKRPFCLAELFMLLLLADFPILDLNVRHNSSCSITNYLIADHPVTVVRSGLLEPPPFTQLRRFLVRNI